MRRVIIESPYAGNIELNLRYLRACMADCLHRGEAPFASHGLYTQPGVLRDGVPEERELGILAGFAWRASAGASVFYVDLGWSNGMRAAWEHARGTMLRCSADGLPMHDYEERTLGGIWTDGGPKDCFGKPTLYATKLSDTVGSTVEQFATWRWGVL